MPAGRSACCRRRTSTACRTCAGCGWTSAASTWCPPPSTGQAPRSPCVPLLTRGRRRAEGQRAPFSRERRKRPSSLRKERGRGRRCGEPGSSGQLCRCGARSPASSRPHAPGVEGSAGLSEALASGAPSRACGRASCRAAKASALCLCGTVVTLPAPAPACSLRHGAELPVARGRDRWSMQAARLTVCTAARAVSQPSPLAPSPRVGCQSSSTWLSEATRLSASARASLSSITWCACPLVEGRVRCAAALASDAGFKTLHPAADLSCRLQRSRRRRHIRGALQVSADTRAALACVRSSLCHCLPFLSLLLLAPLLPCSVSRPLHARATLCAGCPTW